MTRRAVRALGLGYLVALAASTAVRLLHPRLGRLGEDEQSRVVAPRPSIVKTRQVSMAFLDRGPRSDSVPVILLHGSPGDHGEVEGLTIALGRHRRAIAPDLPGFGASSRRIPDYSIAAHARYLLALLDSLGIARAHVVGFSMGGGVALHLADDAPDRVASLTLLSSIGAQEFELLGDYHLNHVIHGLQLAGLWAVHNLVPHFGAWDGGMLTDAYARNFFDSDQRPLRAILSRYGGPAQVIQGARDPLVDPAVARESSRLLPQSDLVMFLDPDATHFMAFRQPERLAATMDGFFRRVEHGETPIRATASDVRLAAAARPFDPRSIPPVVGVALGVLLLMLVAATFVSEDLSCVAAGLMVSRGTIGFGSAATACLVGIVLGDLWLFGMGWWLGRAAVRRAPLRWFVSESAVQRSAKWFARRGMTIVLITRCIPGSRLPTYLAAGIVRASPWRFATAFLIGAVIWTPLIVGANVGFGEAILARLIAYKRFALWGVLLLSVGVFLVVKVIIPLFSWRGRRLLLSRWYRLTRWEFWPRWAFYPPVLGYVAWESVRRGRLTLFTAVNPGIPGGGFAGESKAQILGGLAHAPDRVARWELLPAGTADQRLPMVDRFLERVATEYPIVLKPDVGERGSGVAIISCREEARRYLGLTREPLLAQVFVPGVEFGIFYYRYPGTPRGKIFAITDKRFPTVIGDGRSSLESLILKDDRAITMARYFLTKHGADLDRIPAAGETVPLTTLGTHCRGSVFFDGEWIRTPELESAIDELSRGFEGFWFGRYDVRAPSAEDLMRGKNFKVLELNGATAEATSIYDPKNGLGSAYRTLRRQWSILFEIAERNVRAGTRPARVSEIFALLERHRRARQAHVEI